MLQSIRNYFSGMNCMNVQHRFASPQHVQHARCLTGLDMFSRTLQQEQQSLKVSQKSHICQRS